MKASITARTLDSSTIFSASRAHLKSLLSTDSTTSLKPRATRLTSELDKHPVLFIEVKAPTSFAKRKQADDQMRDIFRDLRHNLVTPYAAPWYQCIRYSHGLL
jgi:hypothetical protein